jgi:predicted transposase/invertase (TIGR01784 family)
MLRYINPYVGFAFKYFWGERGSRELLIDFLNQLIPAHHQIAELQFRDNGKLSHFPDKRRAYFDIQCRSTTGEEFMVQFQQSKINFFNDCSLFYSNFSVSDKGWWSNPSNFGDMHVYFIAILDFLYDEYEEREKFLRQVERKDHEVAYRNLHFRLLQMPLLAKKKVELVTHFDKWVYFLKHLSKFDHIPAILQEPIFEKAFHTAEVSNMSEAQHKAYEQSWLDYISMNAVVNSALDQGLEKGIRQGIEIGIEKGREEEKQRSREESERKERALVLKLNAKGLQPNEISEISGVAIEKILDIIADVTN